MFLPHNCLFDKDIAYSYVTIKQTAVADCQIEVTFKSVFILKAIDST